MCNCVKCLRNDFVSFYPSAIEINYLNLNLKPMKKLSVYIKIITKGFDDF